MNEANVAFGNDREQVDEAFDIRAPGEARVELAGAEGAVAGAVEDGAEAVLVKERAETGVVFGVAGEDAVAGEAPVVLLTDGEDLVAEEALDDLPHSQSPVRGNRPYCV